MVSERRQCSSLRKVPRAAGKTRASQPFSVNSRADGLQLAPVPCTELSAFVAAQVDIVNKTISDLQDSQIVLPGHCPQFIRLFRDRLDLLLGALLEAMATGEVGILNKRLSAIKVRGRTGGLSAEQMGYGLIIYRKAVLKVLSRDKTCLIRNYLDWMLCEQEKLSREYKISYEINWQALGLTRQGNEVTKTG